ncbi:retrovirus-related pol polyprotein from transposon TNT 1-94 [Tanacetum coccineum]
MDLETTQTNTAAKLPLLKQGAVTTEEKTQKKNDVKSRSMLLMALPNEHLLTFNQYKDAKTLFDAIQTRFGGNDATKKTQKTLLKQIQLAILGENISQEDLNLKFLRSLPSEWNTHVVVWRNKSDLDSMSFDDLYNNFKIIKQEVKRTITSSSNSGSQNMAFVSTPNSTNEVNTANVQVSTANSSVSTDSTLDSTANLSDATVYAFLANQPNGSQLVHEDLKQIHKDDLEEMDLKWQLALLSMRARRYYQRTRKKITINGSDTAGYDKSKIECFNCHKIGHFARECKSHRNQESRPRNHDNGNRNQDSSRRNVNVEETSSKAMVAIDGAALKTQLDNLSVEFNKSEFNLATYKRGLASVEEQLVFYKKNEVKFSDHISVLKRDASFKDSKIIALKSEIEKLKIEKDRKGVSYNAIPPPPIGLFAPPTIDLSNYGLEEFKQPKFKGYKPKASKSVSVDTSNEIKKTPDTPLVEELVSKKEKQTVFPTKIEFVKQQDKTSRKPIKYAEMYRSQKPRGNQRNWNNLKSQQLGSDFMMYNKACLKWQLALLSMRARRYYQRTGKKITINGSDTTGYDNSKVECFNCHKMGHFARECRSPRNQESRPRNHDNGNRNQDSSRRTVNVEETSSKAMVAIDGAGFDWSFMVEEEMTTNMALMAFSDSEVYNDKICSNTCLKSFEALKTQLDNLRVEFNKSEFNLATYKRGLASVEEQLVFYKKNEVMFSDQISVLKRDASFKDLEIIALKSEIEKLKKEKEWSQISDNSRKGVGYNVVPPPSTGLFAPPTIDLSNSGLEEFQQPKFKGYGPKASKSVCIDTSNKVKKTPDTSLVEKLVSEKEKQTIFPTKIEFVKQQVKTARKPVKYAEMYRSQKPRGNQRNWNNLKSQQLGSNFVMYNKACFVCGSFDHVQAHCKYHQRERVVYGNNYNRLNYNYTTNRTHPNAQRNMVPRAVLMKTGLKHFNIARTINIALPKSIVFGAKPMLRFSKSAQSTIKRPYQSKTVLTNKNFSQKVNTAKAQAVNTTRPKAVNTARPNYAVVNIVRANQANAIKASGNPPTDDQGYVDSRCSRHMTVIFSYLSDFQEFDGGYVTFDGGQKEDGIFISQDKYVTDILKKFGFQDVRTTSIPMDTEKPLLKDSDGDDVDVHLYRLMIGSLMYLTSSRPDIMFACKKQTMVATSSTEAEYVAAASCYGQVLWIQNQMLDYGHVKRGRDTKIPQSSGPPIKVGDEAVHKELGDRMERAATTASSLEAEQDSDAQTRFEAASKQSNDPPLSRVNTLGSGEDNMKLIELMAHCTTLSELDGVMEITATIDGRVKTITEASIRRHLKLEDSDGISTLPTAEIFEQLALMGINLGEHSIVSNNASSGGEGPTILVESHHTPTSGPSTSQLPSTPPSIQTTPIAKEAAPMPHESPLLRVHSLGSDEGSLSLNELTVLCTSLSKKVESLESELKQTKQTYSTALTKLIKRVKKLEQLYNDNQLGESQKMDLDAGISLVPPHVADQGRFDDTQELAQQCNEQNKPDSMLNRKQSLKANMNKERLAHENAMKIQKELDAAPQDFSSTKEYMSTTSRIKNYAKSYSMKHLHLRRTREASGSVQEQTLKNQKQKNSSHEKLHQMKKGLIPVEEFYVEALQKLIRLFDDLLKNLTAMDKDKLLKFCFRKDSDNKPTKDKARELWVELKRLFEPDDNDTLWKLQRYMHDPLNWWLYDTCGVHHVLTQRGHIFTVVEKDYPLPKALAT